MRIRPKVNYGSVEITEERAIYTDCNGVKWRLYDFAAERGTKRIPVRVGSISASMRIYVREGGTHRRCVIFSPRDDTLTPSFNHHSLPTAMVQRLGRWVDASNIENDRTHDLGHPLAKPRFH